MRLYCNWPVWGQSGWEVICRSLLLALDKLGVTIYLESKDDWNYENIELDREDSFRLQRMQDCRFDLKDCDAHLFQQYVPGSYLTSPKAKTTAKKICMSLFETDRCPNAWIPGFSMIDEVWTFSKFNKESWEKSRLKNIKVMPFGIDGKIFNPDVKPIDVKGRKTFMFIANGDFTERKWFEGLIEAFVTEFNRDDDVCLLIKAHYGGFIRPQKDAVIEVIRNIAYRFNRVNPPTVLYIGDKVPYEEMGKFYKAGSCYVLASRGEGLGLPYAEALACGVPVISTRFGGQMEFLNDENAFFVDYDLQLIYDLEYLKKCLWAVNSCWAQPKLLSLRATMRFILDFYELAQKKALKGAEDMKERTWQKAALWCIKRILELQGKKNKEEVQV